MAKQLDANFKGGTMFKGLQGKPDFDWEDKPLKPMSVSALPPHLQAAHRLRTMRMGPSKLQKLKRQAVAEVWTMERFQEEVEKAIVKLKSDNKKWKKPS